MLAEAESPELQEKAFDMTHGWSMFHIMNGIVKGEISVANIDAYLEREFETYPRDAYRMYFTSNHDENSWNGSVFERLGERAKSAAFF